MEWLGQVAEERRAAALKRWLSKPPGVWECWCGGMSVHFGSSAMGIT